MNRHDRINIDQADHETYQRLCDRHVPFRTMKDVFMTAVLLGFRSGKERQRLTRKLGPFDTSVLTLECDIPIVRSIAVQATGDLRVLEDDDEVLKVAEEYANVGIHILKSEVLDAPGSPPDNLLRFLEREFRLDLD